MRTDKEREARIQQLMSSCQHFNGIMNDKCKVGVSYEAITESRTKALPCIVINLKSPRPKTVCAFRSTMTREEAEAAYEVQEATWRVTRAAMAAAHTDAEGKGLRKGNGGVSSMQCPVCENTLDYSVAGINGHMHARCRTTGCVRWME